MPHPGSRNNPVRLEREHDLERATRHVARPSAAQASAGNYRKAHIYVGGLPVTIESPRYSIRRGVAPDGTPWAVMLPADYGYIKRSEGADGDGIDVYLGPFAHSAHLLPVWVVDQCDADTGVYDEHKCMLGFADRTTARDTYVSAFSDGRGHHRIGGVAQMSFADFRNWVASGDTKSPLVCRKSASLDVNSVTYGARNSFFRGFGATRMTVPNTTSDNNTAAPKAVGTFTKMLSSVLKSMTPEDRSTFMADASVLASTELGKAGDLLSQAGDMTRAPFIEDHWNDNPGDRLSVTRAHGPGSSAPFGDVPVGPEQRSSGDGALRMEREYSRYAPQYGVTESATILGRQIAGVQGAMKSMLLAMEGLGSQIEVLKSAAAAPTAESLQAMISEAVGKALDAAISKAVAPLKAELTQLVVKAEDKEDEKEDDDEAKHASLVLSKSEDETKKERDDEEDEKDEKSAALLSAASFRLMAKSRVDWAKIRVSKALDLAGEGKVEPARRQMDLAEVNLSKAEAFLAKSTALRVGKTPGFATEKLTRLIAKARKVKYESIAENQDVWPNTGGATETHKSAPSEGTGGASAPAISAAEAAKISSQVQAALSGVGMLQASVSDLFKAVQGIQNTPAASSGGGEVRALPATPALVKSTDALMNREAALLKARNEGAISFTDYDKGREVLMHVRMGLPEETIQAQISKMPDAMKSILTQNAA